MRPHAYFAVVRKGRSADRIVSPTRRIVAQDTLARPGWPAWRVRRALTLLSLLSTGWVACGGGGGRDEGAAPLILGYTADLQTLNPLVSTDQNANDLIYHLLYTPLVTYDSTYRVRPWLAESWEFEGKSVVFTLRDNVRWHDGAPVTAHDVKFTFDMAKDERSGSPLGAVYLADVTDAEVLDPHSIRFTLASLGSQPLESFYWPPVPRHLLEDVPPEEMSRHPFGRSPVGSGPYRLVRWQAGEQLVFEENEAFAPSLGGPPAIGRVLYRIVPERTTLLSEFIRGEVDVYGTIGPTPWRSTGESSGRLSWAVAAALRAVPYRRGIRSHRDWSRFPTRRIRRPRSSRRWDGAIPTGTAAASAAGRRSSLRCSPWVRVPCWPTWRRSFRRSWRE
jgi:ABC-type transport system substrate-binding protein